MQEGILVGADRGVEELIPWWWEHYSRYNRRPVVLVDFGMSKKGKAWCKGRIDIVKCPLIESIKTQADIQPELARTWKNRYRGALWRSRKAWFKKPTACLLSPFDRTLWLDLDCEVCGPLDPLFAEWKENIELAIAREDFRLSKQEMFNSGVILFQKGASFLKEWEKRCQAYNETMMGDQDVLTALLLEGNVTFKEISPLYNWPMYAGITPGILIAHWVTGWGKKYIQTFGGLQAFFNAQKYPPRLP